jgi:hypothetical protein
MGANQFFWPQELLDQWIVEEKIVLEGEQLTILEENRTYLLNQAVYFIEDVGDGSDQYKLVGRVKNKGVLEEMEAEHYMDSVLIGDSAYQVVSGFAGAPEAKIAEQIQKKSSDITGAIASQTGDETDVDDRELLARFLIDNL